MEELKAMQAQIDYLTRIINEIVDGDVIHTQIPVGVMLNANGKYPEYKTEGSAAADVEAAEYHTIMPGGIAIVGTGIFPEVPIGYKLNVDSRSGLASQGVFVINAPGKIDSDYRGELKVLLCNLSGQVFSVNIGDRIAQVEIAPVKRIKWIPKQVLSRTARGAGGLGSTGK